MKEIVVLSGKGGAGKTSITAAMFALTPNSIAIDADVDAADLAMLVGSSTIRNHVHMGRTIAVVDPARCNGCGRCERKCNFGALSLENRKLVVDALSCEGCGVCELMCPRGAIRMQSVSIGTWQQAATPFGRLLHARLLPGEENSGKFVAFLRKEGRATAKALGADWIWTDGPPGIGCSAISSLSGADRVLLVVAPGESGRHDALRSLELAKQFRIPVDVVSNRGQGDDGSCVQAMAESAGARYLGAIPRDEAFVDAEFAGTPVLALASETLKEQLETLCKKVLEAA
jgi:MinD superfamily P-loop ATPase